MAASLSSFCPAPHPRCLSKPISRTRPSSLGALASSKMDKEPYWVSINADITSHLKLRLPTGSVPSVLHQSIHHLLSATPPTLAPALCVAACELVGGYRSTSLAVASALRLMHVASFTHHNLHNFPASHPVNIALLSGDAILPLGYELAAGAVHDGDVAPERVLRAIAEIARAMGAKGATHAGEKKEGALFPCGAACGAILGGADEERIEKLRRLGYYTEILLGATDRRGIKSHEKGSSLCLGDDVPETAEGLRSLALMELKGLHSTASDALSGLADIICCTL